MKKKNSPSDLVTKQYFDEALDIRFSFFKDEVIREMKEIITENNSMFFTRIDPILAEIETARQDREITTDQIQRINLKHDDHERRITKLENN